MSELGNELEGAFSHEELEELRRTVGALRRLEDPLLDEFLELLPPESGPEREMPARWLPVCDSLLGHDLNCAPATRPVVDAFLHGIHGFAWNQTYTADDFGAAFLERYPNAVRYELARE